MIAFGTIHYFRRNIRAEPGRAISAIKLICEHTTADRQVFQGMFAGTDKWSRATKMTERALTQLYTDIAGGVFDDIVGFRGSKNHEVAIASLSGSGNPTTGELPYHFSLVADCASRGQLCDWERAAHAAWQFVEAGYGVSVVLPTVREVQAELAAVPIVVRGISDDPANEARLRALQVLRGEFGAYVRPATWGTYLGADLVTRLGGVSHVLTEAPVGFAEELSGGGVYLRLAKKVDAASILELNSEASKLTRYLAPILLPQFRS
jgi:hypothetical protein